MWERQYSPTPRHSPKTLHATTLFSQRLSSPEGSLTAMLSPPQRAHPTQGSHTHAPLYTWRPTQSPSVSPPHAWPWLMMHSHGCNAHRMHPTHHRPVAVDELHSGSAPKLMHRPPLVTTTATDTVAVDVTHSADSVEPTSSMKRCCSHTWSSSSVFALSP